ncbi:MAG: iron-sulfur cluster biosynthesis protein, partial [Proteobacteria bacterium]|nr:iron-sulfur cluster biosynthesis protein [Pseudomonadota bacterium]
MKIDVTDKAVSWFEKELLLDKGDAIRFFGKTYGNTEVHDGFSVGMSVDQPDADV